MKKVILFGATGNIGQQALELLSNNSDFQLVGVSAGKNVEQLTKILDAFPSIQVVYLSQKNQLLEKRFFNIKFYYENDIVKLLDFMSPNNIVINALSGFFGLQATIAAVCHLQTILLANKESLVCGGNLVAKLLQENPQSQIIPIDSEHAAIFQCLDSNNAFRNLYLTASGGSLRDLSLEETEFVTKERVLNHPSWNMGEKITVDSATMMNKAFEIIEAHHLFKTKAIQVLLHPQSIIHSMVEFHDFSIKAQLSIPDMRQVINFGLYYPKILTNNLLQPIDFTKLVQLNLQTIDADRFVPIRWAFQCLDSFNSKAIALNAANEVAVEAFLKGVISFREITKIVGIIFNEAEDYEIIDYDCIYNFDLEIRKKTRQLTRH
ncbi:1-deoxy-D-xylulose 5-phosphate reductoisomerase [Spiroplasma sabaudiense Ar-1343]|uniref:1-deoxy-D-xylulose 5-phosphate reductoisomerase n=1 Tax=Spiroplasma sabaudiense Ar-1343 TaxID=1276257 RepID=W6AA92_9MOLU|nr:1-deoxy-D-xylulose-5-phosphate reductoisomerase [Spiroplasma sabaudiense]AHI53982.1 1-deoxy-D-xylulose 5-phosphate reductoisomerase [Spiroplasma sabaudiense Ar-1343]